MSLSQHWEAVVSGRQAGPAAALARSALVALSGLTWIALQANLVIYRLGLRRRVRLDRPVVVVGNLTVGGTGKTTATIFLARRLAGAGVHAGVILRGYRRCSGGPGELLVSDHAGLRASPPEAGDEAVLLATALPGHPVAVGVRREKVARRLLQEAPVEALVLDDGFQYFRLARDADVVLVDASRDFEDDRLFPAGRLREPHGHLRRATQVWITHAELATPERLAGLQEWLSRHVPGLPVVTTAHRPTGLRLLFGEGDAPAAGAKVVALSALGNPQSFEAALAGRGYQVEPVRFADHHRYGAPDWSRVAKAVRASGAAHIVTTEKDAVKLPAPPPGLPPVWAAGCELSILEGSAIVDRLVEAILSWPASLRARDDARSSAS